MSSKTRLTPRTTLIAAVLAAGAWTLQPASAAAQSAPTDRPRVFETPLGMDARAITNRPIGPQRDGRFNRTRALGGNAAGVGGGSTGTRIGASATAIGNQITVITQGSGNTVTVNAKQTNTGSQSAIVVLNGRLNLD
jgi:holdfast attachment protein HfaA